MVFSITALIQQLVLCFYAALQVFSRSGSAKKQWFKPQKLLNLLQECLCLSGFGDTITGTSLPMAPHISVVQFVSTAFSSHYNSHWGTESGDTKGRNL